MRGRGVALTLTLGVAALGCGDDGEPHRPPAIEAPPQRASEPLAATGAAPLPPGPSATRRPSGPAAGSPRRDGRTLRPPAREAADAARRDPTGSADVVLGARSAEPSSMVLPAGWPRSLVLRSADRRDHTVLLTGPRRRRLRLDARRASRLDVSTLPEGTYRLRIRGAPDAVDLRVVGTADAASAG